MQFHGVYACYLVLSRQSTIQFPNASKTTVRFVPPPPTPEGDMSGESRNTHGGTPPYLKAGIRQGPERNFLSGPCIDSRTIGRLQLGSSGWTRTNNIAVNSRTLCQLSYRGLTGRGLYMDGFVEPKIRPSCPRGQDRTSCLFLRLIRVRRCCSSAAVCGGCRNGLLSLTYMAHRV